MAEQKKSKEDLERAKESQELIDAAAKYSSPDADLFQDYEEESEISIDFISGSQDPDLQHKLYYAMRPLIVTNLPKGKDNYKFRNFVNEPRKVFLNRGKGIDPVTHRRGSEEKMSYTVSHLMVALKEVIDWVKMGANPLELRDRFHDLNVKYGYRDMDDKDYYYIGKAAK